MQTITNLPPGVSTSDLPECAPRPWRNDDLVLSRIDCDFLGKWITKNRMMIEEWLGDLEFSRWPESLKKRLIEDAEEEQRRNPVEDAA